MQPQSAAAGVHAAGAVLLVEPLKHKGQRLGGNACARVLDAHLYHIAAALGGKADRAARRGELDGIIHNIIHDLMHKIRVRVNQQRIAAQTLDVDLAVLDALLVGEHDVGDGFPQIVGLRVDGHLARLELGNIQHVLHQPRQAARLLRDDAQIMLCFLGRDRAVQHAVDEALDGRHGRAQLVGDVAHELPAGIVDGLQPRSHVIEGGRKVSQLHAAVHRRTGRKVPAAQAACGLTDVLDRAGDALGQHPAQDAAQNQDDRRRDAEHRQHIGHVAAQRSHRAGGKQVAVLPAHRDAAARRVILGAVDTVQRAGLKNVVSLVQLVNVGRGHACACKGVVPRMQQDLAVLVGDEHQRTGGRVEQLKPAVGAFQHIFPLQGLCDDGALIGESLTQRCRAVEHIGQRAFALPDEVRRRQCRLDRAHNAEPQHEHGGDSREKFAADRVAAAHSLTSNL